MFTSKIKLPSGAANKIILAVNLAFYGLIFFIAASFLILYFFLYRNFYITLSQAEEIVILKSELAVDILDYDLYRRIKESVEKKQSLPSFDWSKFPNPFLPYKSR